MPAIFSSLASANYRRYFTGALFSNIGSWMGRTAVSWLVLMELTDGSASALGFVTAIMFLPGLVLAPVAGSVADRFAKRKILLLTQSVFAVDAVFMAALVLSGRAELWMVYLISFIDGLCFTLDNPARQSFVSELVGAENLPNAIGLNSASFNTARLIGPGLAGLMIAALGTGWVLALDCLTYGAMLLGLLRLNPDELHPAPVQTGRGRTREGFRYALGRPDLLVLLACGFAVGGLGFNFQISNAVMATQFYGRGPGEYGVLGSAMGAGALAAALWAAGRGQARLRFILGGMAGYTVFNLVAAFSPRFGLFAALQVPIGLATATVLVTGNTLIQSGTSPQMRGRVMALWGLVIMGVTPLVSPLVGWLGDHLGPQSTVLFGVVCVGISLVLITFVIMRTDQIRLRLGTGRHGWVWLERGSLSEDVDEPKH
ncbi:MAG: MFS transporter [Acidobacteriota bacterium]|nr:MFS transporter [Acidobacteriota bacterium]